MSLPTGTVTFLFTDIVGSTRLWERHPHAMPSALACHNDLLRRAIEGQGGHVFKTVGDAFYAVFASVGAALAAAAAAQQRLCAQDWSPLDPLQVRMALWTGEATPTGDDYAGHVLSAVSRLIGAGHGGQILLPSATEALARESLPEGTSLRDLGPHRFRDLPGSWVVFQLVCPDLPQEFPPLRTPSVRSHNLPLAMTTFVGRERELAEVRQKLTMGRLLTVTGAGGSGKTRLALQAARERLEDYADGVWLVELAPLSDPALVPQAAAAALGVREEADHPLARTLAQSLQNKTLLLLLDNCEHLIAACAALAETLLQACPSLQILATSREPLAISGEVVLPVPPLSVPDLRRLPDWKRLAHFGAVQLFIERAQTASPSFVLSAGNAPAVAQVCGRLDGIPLALELAAARVKVLSVEQISQRLDDRFRLLTGGSRTALPRQQTLRALIDWSYDLLSGPERLLLRRLSIFAGGCALEAAEQVCAGDGLDAFDALDLLGQLTDKSLVQADAVEGERRFRLLETIRQYGINRLAQDDGDGVLPRRHRDYFLTLAETAAPQLTGPEQARWLDRLELEHDNLRAALELSQTEDDPETGLRLAAALHRFWYVRGYLREGRGWLKAMLARGGQDQTNTRAKALSGAGILAWAQGDLSAARLHLEQALALQQARDDQSEIASCLNNLAIIASIEEDFVAAWPLYEQSLALYRAIGDTAKIAILLGNLGGLAKDAGDLKRARSFFEESLAVHRRMENPGGRADVLENLAQLACEVGDREGALIRWRECLTLRRDLGDSWGIANALDNLALTCGQGDTAQAVRLLAAAQAVRDPLGIPRPPSAEVQYQADLAAARTRLDGPSFSAAWAEGKALSVTEAISEALGVAP